MGTRADFYIGVGSDAEWLGSVAWDGYQWAEDTECELMQATTEDEFRGAVKNISLEREDWTDPEQGWPWPWEDSTITDYTYYFHNGKASHEDIGPWPNMKDRQKVTYGPRSGIIVVGAKQD